MSEKMKFNVFIKGKNVDLVVLDEEAVEKTDWFNWFNDEENTKYMKHRYYPNNRAKQLAFYKNEIENNPKKLQVGIFHNEDKVLIGVISLNDIDFLNRNCNTGAIIGVKKYRKDIIKRPFLNSNSCSYYDKCEYKKEICKTSPPLREIENKHLVACYLY